MGRKPLLLFLLVLVPVGLLLGFLLRGWLQPPPAWQPTQPLGITAPEDVPPQELVGWCCMRGAASCVQSPSSLQCLDRGGRGFHKTQDGCNRLCEFLSTRR